MNTFYLLLLLCNTFVFEAGAFYAFNNNYYASKLPQTSKNGKMSSGDIPAVPTVPTTLQTASWQFMRLFQRNSGLMSRNERIMRIAVSLFLLGLSKTIALASPLLFRTIIRKDILDGANTQFLNFTVSMLGLVVALGVSKLISAIVQLICELILSPATTSAAEVLPAEAFSSALSSASQRDGECPTSNRIQPILNSPPAELNSLSSPHGGKSGFARRALDRGIRASNQLLYRAIFNLLPSFVESFTVFLLLLAKTGKQVGITSGIIALCFVILSGLAMNVRLPILREGLNAEGNANSCADEALSLAETVAAFGTIKIEERRYSNALHQVSNAYLKVRLSFSLLKLLQNTILGLGLSAVTFVTIKTYKPFTFDENLSGRLVLVQSLFSQLCAPLNQVGQQLRDCLSSIEDLRELEGLKLSGVSRRENMSTDLINQNNKYDTTLIPTELPLLPLLQSVMSNPVTGQLPPILEVRNITFRYPSIELLNANKKPILKDISLVLPTPGYSIGIVGPSGSGKSTLLRLLLGIESIRSIKNNNFGSILLGGYDISTMTRYPLFCLVGQENDLFGSLSLVDNIRYGIEIIKLVSPEEDREALTAAVEEARLESVIARIDGGLNAAVGPRGRLLSGGERQRVCLARALYRQRIGRGILLLDEATSALDAQTEQMVVNAIMGRVSKGAAAIMISHKLASVQRCDEIIVLRDGAVIQRGSHSQLVEEEGWYADAWQLQSQRKQKSHESPELADDVLRNDIMR